MPDGQAIEALPEGFDLDALVAAIPGDAPAGSDLRSDYSAESPYFRLRDARSEAQAEERRAETAGEAEAAPPLAWRSVAQFARAALTERSKDLEIAAWLTDALVRLHGLSGLLAGTLLMQRLVETYWDGLHPMPDEDGMATRVNPIGGLSGGDRDGTLVPPLRRMSLFRRSNGKGFTWWDYERALDLAKLTDPARRQKRIDEGILPLDAFEKEARAAGTEQLGRLRATLLATIAAWRELGETLDRLAGNDAPSTRRVLALLTEIEETVRPFAPPDSAPETPASAEVEAAKDGTVQPGPRGGSPVVAGQSRDELLRQLVEIAEYFRKTEPNSPLSFTLQEAVRRARMPWPELLAEIVPDGAARCSILSVLGIRPPE